MKFDPVSHAIPFWEKRKGGGPITDILRLREKDKDKKGSAPVAPLIQPAAVFPSNGNHWRSYRGGRDG